MTDRARRLRRHPDSVGTEVDGEMFLVKATDEDIYHLDTMATGLWRLLEHPCEAEALEVVLADAFPDIPTATIRSDVARAIDALIDAGYVIAEDATEAPPSAGPD